MRTWRSLVLVGAGLMAMAGCGQKAGGLTVGYPAQTRDRAVVANRMTEGGVYVGWRLLPGDKADAGFNVYRQASDGAVVLVNAKPITQSTNLVDCKAPAAGSVKYIVEAVGSGERSCATASGEAGANYITLPVKIPGRLSFFAMADLTGDGRLDYVLRYPGSMGDPFERYWHKSQDTFKIEAYDADGKFMWRHDMGWSIEQMGTASPIVVYDVDGDGKAEVYCKGGEGDPRGADGKVKTGPEYVIKIDGMTGKVVARADWPDRTGWENEINTPERNSTYNFSNRNEIAVAYLDGKHPSVVVQRGLYSLVKLSAFDGNLKRLWAWRSDAESTKSTGTGNDIGYRGEGTHGIRVADVDGDGRDEIVYGAACVDDNGKGLWTLGMGHPDAVHISDIDPTNPGLEIVYGFEARQPMNGICVVDAKTGRILRGWPRPTKHVEGIGMFGYVTDLFPGPQFASFEAHVPGVPLQVYGFSCATGEELEAEGLCGDSGTTIWWDADDYKEIISGEPNPNPTDHHRQIMGPVGIHKYKGPMIEPVRGGKMGIADVMGDWREEMVASVNGEIRIYTTNIPTTTRRPWLMSDHKYYMEMVCGAPPEPTVMPIPQGSPQPAPVAKVTATEATKKAATQPAKKAAAKAPKKAAAEPAKAATK